MMLRNFLSTNPAPKIDCSSRFSQVLLGVEIELRRRQRKLSGFKLFDSFTDQ